MKLLIDLFESEIGRQQVFGDFRYSKSRRAFLKRLESQTHSVHFSYIAHRRERDIDVRCNVAIRYDDVEARLRSREESCETRKDETFTIGAELGALAEQECKQWTVCCADTARIAALELAYSVQVIAIPFFRRYEDPSAAAAALETAGGLARIICPVNPSRTLRVFRALGYC